MSEEPQEEPTPTPNPSRSDPPPPSLKPAPQGPPVSIPKAPPPGPPPANEDERHSSEAETPEDESDEPGSPARLNPRLLAGLIDGFVSACIYVMVPLVIPGHTRLEGTLAMLLGAGYMVVRDSLPFMGNQSIGKMAMKLKVVKNDGSSISQDWTTALIRNALLIFGPLALVDAIVLIVRDNSKDRGRRLGDEWAKTRVVVAGERESPDSAV